MPVLLSAVGLCLLALAASWRRRAPGRRRWWAGGGFYESAALVGVPGIGLALVCAWPMSLVDDGVDAAAVAVLPFAVGLGGALWTGLFLPTPRWLQPHWYRVTAAARRRDRRR